MPTIKDKLYFNFDGKSSRNFGLMHINTGNDMFEDSLVGSRSIIETKIAGNDRPNFSRIETAPREFSMSIAFTKGFTENDLDEIVLWLFNDGYAPLYFDENPEKIYYCTPIDEPNLVHNGLRQGYITLKMRCDSPYIYSPVEVTPRYNVTTSKTINIANRGHYIVYPEISIKKIGNGDISFTGSNNGVFEIKELANGESIYINCEKDIIESDIIGTYRYNNVIGQYQNLKLDRGLNTIIVKGVCDIEFRYVFKYKF